MTKDKAIELIEELIEVEDKEVERLRYAGCTIQSACTLARGRRRGLEAALEIVAVIDGAESGEPKG